MQAFLQQLPLLPASTQGPAVAGTLMSLAGTLLLIEASFCNSRCPCCAGTVEVPAGVPQAVPSTPAPEQDPIQLLMLDMKAAEVMQKVPGLQGPAARHLLKVSCLSSLDLLLQDV